MIKSVFTNTFHYNMVGNSWFSLSLSNQIDTDQNLYYKVNEITMSRCCCLVAKSCLNSFATPWTVTCQYTLSMGFPGQESWSGLPLPPPGNFPQPGIETESLA